MGFKRVVANSLCKPIANIQELARWVRSFTGLTLPKRAVCPGHDSPLIYLALAHFEPAKDLVVWAPRGGGKTRLGAVATLLDLLLKPGCQVRILGGSLEQSFKMWEHLQADVHHILSTKVIAGQVKGRRIEFKNGSAAAVLTQSQRAVRGLRVQKLRCDEVELFDPQVWTAAQLTTRTQHSPLRIAGTIEALSTLHTPFGLMQRVIEQAETLGTTIVKWCLMEVLERCPQDRQCASCPLAEECNGIAKTACQGFVKIEDAIAMKKRVSRETWDAEMLCRRPSTRNSVFPSFDPAIHVTDKPNCEGELWLGIDFGFAAPFVCLWIVSAPDGSSYVIDEYVQEQRMIDEHVQHIRRRPWGAAKKIACDPAGQSRSDQTAVSDVTLLRHSGFQVKCKHSAIVDGVEWVRRALRPAFGQPKLFIHPRCTRLIKAMLCYHYAEGGSELPLKDGEHDHLIDALRYYFVNRESGGQLKGRRY
ncbi:MAG: hypothetical protein NTU53_05120 [Planctomycetota bacterium]|nr:hypothetical protein [Planctomycetota bacterium]